VFTVTDGGFAKRTAVVEYRQQGRGGIGIKAMKLNEDRGSLVGGLVVTENDEVIAIKASGQVTRSAVAEVPVKGRDTMGVKFVGVSGNDSVVVIALNPETTVEAAEIDGATADGAAGTGAEVDPPAEGSELWLESGVLEPEDAEVDTRDDALAREEPAGDAEEESSE